MKRKKFKFCDLPIKWQFFVGLLSVSVIPMLVFGMYMAMKTRETFLEESYRQMEENLAQATQNVDMVMEKYVNTSSLIYMNKEVQSLIAMDFSDYNYEDLYYYLKQFIGEIGSVHDEVENFSIYTTNETVASDGKLIFRTDGDIASEDWYKKTVQAKGQAVFLSTEKEANGQNYFYLSRLLDCYNFEDICNVLRMKINEKYIFRVISETDSQNKMMILDQENRIISSGNKEEIGRKAEDVLEKYNGKFQDGQRNTAQYQGQSMLVSSLEGNWGWKVLYLVSAEEIDQGVLSRIRDVILFGLVSVVISLLLANGISKVLTGRIKLLIEAVKRMQQGVFGEQVNLEGKDEIGELAKAFSRMSVKVDFLIKENYKKEILRKSAELNMLQEQINPHFLYNALSSVSVLAIRNGNKEIWHMVQNLAEFYRISLNKGKNILTVGEEINLLKSYLSIQEIRFGEKLKVCMHVPGELMHYETIKLILQPVVENAIHHGMRDDGSALEITICLEDRGDFMEFTVEDNGTGIGEEKVQELNCQMRHGAEGYGLKNVAARLQMQYGEKYGVKIYSEEGEWTRVTIKLPKNEKAMC